MKNALIGLLIGLILGTVGGFAGGIFVYPFIFLDDIVAEDKLAADDRRRLVAKGEFLHANPADPVHYGRGHVSVYDNVVHLEADFEVGPGPDYHVYLVPVQEVTPATAVDETMFIDLGRLRAYRGSQIYPVPDGLDLHDYTNVVIWCEHFGVLISPAPLAPPEFQ